MLTGDSENSRDRVFILYFYVVLNNLRILSSHSIYNLVCSFIELRLFYKLGTSVWKFEYKITQVYLAILDVNINNWCVW